MKITLATAVMYSIGIGFIALGVFGILDEAGILEFNFVYPMIIFGLAVTILGLYGYTTEK